MPRYQYQAKTQTFLEDAPQADTLGWFVQPSEPVRRKRRPVDEGFFAAPIEPGIASQEEVAADVTGPIAVETTVVVRGKLIQYQAKVEPFAPEVADPATFGALRQPSEPVRRRRRADPGFFAMPPTADAAADTFGWFVQPSEPVRAQRRVDPGLFVLPPPADAAQADTLGWFVQASEPVRRRRRALDVGAFALLPTADAAQPDTLGWFAQPSEPVRRKRQTPLGLFVVPPAADAQADTFGWFAQPNEPVRRRRRADPGFSILPPAADVVADTFGWFAQASEPIRRKRHAAPGFFTIPGPADAAQADTFGWFQQASEPRRRKRSMALLVPGLVDTFGAPVTFSAADWPFLAQFNPDDYPTGTLFYFEAVLDTSDAAFAAQARLFNITDAVAVAGSTVTTSALHLAASATRQRSAAITLPSGNKEYRAERGGATGSGATVHLHQVKILPQHS